MLGPDDVARGAVLFPVVGAGIGALVGGVAVGLESRLTLLLAAALAVAGEALVTGAIHLDALADTADGLGAPTRERALEVMREPAIGSFGATALGLDLLVKTAALAALLDGPDPVLAATAAFALGRAAPLAVSWALPYARAGGGLDRPGGPGPAPWLARRAPAGDRHRSRCAGDTRSLARSGSRRRRPRGRARRAAALRRRHR